jgi:hypothetical protein
MADELDRSEDIEQEEVETTEEQNVPSERDLSLSSEDRGLGEETPQEQQGGSRAVRRVESQAGRKTGFAKRTAGAKRQATRAAKGGALKKGKGKRATGSQKAGRRQAGKKRPMAGKSPAQKKRRRAA